MRMRLAQIFNTNRIPHPPSVRFEGDWNEVAAAACEAWIETQAAHSASKISSVALSKMKALEYERKNLKDISAGERLLPPTATKQDYYDAEVNAFLEAINIENADDVLESFARAGTGGLHRQHATIGATFSNAFSAASVLVPDPMAKAALSGARLGVQLVTQKAILDSGSRRLRNACAQDVLPHGRPDTAPAGKAAPNVLSASWAVIRQLKGAEQNLRTLEESLATLHRLQCADPPDTDALRVAHREVEFAFARICHQLTTKSAYKAASESAKIEFRGNLRYLLTSYTGTATTMTTGLLAIMTPLVIAAPVTGGMSAGAVALALGLYLGYQLSSGPGEDGKAKGRRAIVALAKLIVVLSGEDTSNMVKRADAFKDYRRDKARALFSLPRRKAIVKREAKEKLLARLEEIKKEGDAENRLAPRRNWEIYRDHARAIEEIKASVAQGRISNDESKERLNNIAEQFRATNAAHLSGKDILDAWKTPMRVRMEAGSRLVKGKVARSHKKLLGLVQHPSMKARFGTARQKADNYLLIEQTRMALRKDLLNMFNYELALRGLKREGDTNVRNADVIVAIERMAAVDDEDVRSLFSGDGRAQVDAVNLSKRLTAGESERYTYANAGASAISIAANTGLAVTDLGVNGAKAAGTYNGPQFNDYKFVALSQAGVQPGAHLSAGDRAAFQAREMRSLLSVARDKADAPDLPIHLEADARGALRIEDDDVAQQIDELVAQLEWVPQIPKTIRLTIQPEQPEAAASSSGNALPSDGIVVDLTSTAAARRVQYKYAPAGKKFRYTLKQLAIGGRQAAMSFFGLPVQLVAQVALRKTRAPLNKAIALDEKVEASLKNSADALAMPVAPVADASTAGREAGPPGLAAVRAGD